MNAVSEPAKSRARGWAVAVVVLAFLAGALAGAGATHLGKTCHAGDDGARQHHLPPPLMALNLSDQQEKQVREILDRYHRRIQETMQGSWPSLKPVFDDMAKEIKVFLTDDQRVRFDEERQKMEDHRFGHKLPPLPNGGHASPAPTDLPDGRMP
jgi:Spy/CpxP family protein refolding chaperone